MERIEYQRNIGYQILRFLYIVIAEVIEILFQHGLCLTHCQSIPGLLGSLIVSKSCHRCSSTGLLFIERRLDIGIALTVRKLIASFYDIVDSRHETVCLTGRQIGQHARK